MNNNFEIIPFENLWKIKPDTFGYIDKEGNFYSLGVAKRFDGMLVPWSTKEMNLVANNILFSLVNKEDLKKYLDNQNINLNKQHPIASMWSADKIILNLGFAKFFRGKSDLYGDTIDDSYYDNPSINQLFVLNYLFTLNYDYSTALENKREELMKLYISKLKEKDIIRNLKK